MENGIIQLNLMKKSKFTYVILLQLLSSAFRSGLLRSSRDRHFPEKDPLNDLVNMPLLSVFYDLSVFQSMNRHPFRFSWMSALACWWKGHKLACLPG